MKIRYALALAAFSLGYMASTVTLAAEEAKKAEDPMMAKCTEKAMKKYKTEKSQKKYIDSCMKKAAKKADKK